jgi:hypothetical protein
MGITALSSSDSRPEYCRKNALYCEYTDIGLMLIREKLLCGPLLQNSACSLCECHKFIEGFYE